MRSWELQQAVHTRLNGFAGLTALVAGVHDHVDQDDAFPYVVVGDDTLVNDDTNSSDGTDNTITIHTWSQYRGKKETKLIQQEIYNALHRFQLVVASAVLVGVIFEFGDSFIDSDGLTRHGVQRFRVILDELS